MSASKSQNVQGQILRPWRVFWASALLIPMWGFIAGLCTHAGSRGLGLGQDEVWFMPIHIVVMFVSFMGMTLAPFLCPRQSLRHWGYFVLALIAWLCDVVASMSLVAEIFGFPD